MMAFSLREAMNLGALYLKLCLLSRELTQNHLWGHSTGLRFNLNSRMKSGVYFFWCHIVPINVYHP